MNALAKHLPKLSVPWVPLGAWPTPLQRVDLTDGIGAPLWIKREGDADPVYGGNKIRTLEAWFGHARALGARRIWAIGAYGSNHVIATVVHAQRAGLEPAALVFPQPMSAWAAENCGALIASRVPVIRLRNVIEVPVAAWRISRRERDAVVMPPGGATTIGTLGAMSAAFELAEQIAIGVAPAPARIVLAAGSTCTTAGLLAGLALAEAVGLWRWPVPLVHAVRVTPWPITSRVRTADLARRSLARVERLGGPRVELGLRALLSRLHVDGRELGGGYGRTTPRCDAALATFDAVHGSPRLDAVYSGKAAAAALRLRASGIGPLLLWASKSTAVLAAPTQEAIDAAPPALAHWWLRSRRGTRDA